ncbi:TRAF3-interacting protein 1 [Eumeta japonica]|uniref:TRAF3-interacting protein 1 n=1 Tax=Eumeta variegata TaxID=151549 RepID=A0A4C1UCX8_EUMVA|nr:TRAF3-interacting protein 1 [Eumeta japonica]
MEKELDKEIKATQATLGKYVKRPPLNEKLLKKPPFRFLHDIVTTVIKNNGFFEGLFDDEELISENVKDRDAKISFLTKLISVLNLATGKALSAKPSKIVAGQEPEKTNELLQCLGYALEKNISSTEAVKKYKDSLAQISKNEKKNKAQVVKNTNVDENEIKKKKESGKSLASKSRETLVNEKKDASKTSKSNNKTSLSKFENKRMVQKKTESSMKTTNNFSKDGNEKSKTKRSVETVLKPEPAETNDSDPKVNELQEPKHEDKKNEEHSESIKTEIKLDENAENVIESANKDLQISEEVEERSNIATINAEDFNDSLDSKSNATNLVTINKEKQNEESIVSKEEPVSKKELSNTGFIDQKSAHLSSDDDSKKDNILPDKSVIEVEQYAPNKNEKKTLLRPPSVRPSSSRPGAPRLREKNEEILPSGPVLMGKVNIIIENAPPDEDEENSIVMVDENYTDQADVASIDIPSTQHGHLVQQILDSQKGLSSSGKPEIEWEFGAQKARETVNQEIEQMKFNIQAVSRVTNPLGKLLDHVQEDVEVMRQELHQWTKIYEEVTLELSKKKMQVSSFDSRNSNRPDLAPARLFMNCQLIKIYVA